jgi:hypothetical protein
MLEVSGGGIGFSDFDWGGFVEEVVAVGGPEPRFGVFD